MKEVWKDVIGYEGLYKVNNFGDIKSLPRNGTIKTERIIKSRLDRYGYAIVSLNKNDRTKSWRVHRLVATAFIPNPDNKPEVNHIDGNKHNNNVENLEWVAKSENQQHAWRTGLKKNFSSKVREKLSKPVLQYDLDGNFIKEFKSQTEAACALNIKSHHISECCHGKVLTASGYIWRFKKDKIKTKMEINLNKMNKSTKSVNQYSKDGKFIRKWDRIIDAANALNIDNSSIGKCCRKRQRSAGGYIWKYSG